MRSKQEVLDYMRRREREGEGYAALGELQDAYPGVRQDLEVSVGRGGGIEALQVGSVGLI